MKGDGKILSSNNEALQLRIISEDPFIIKDIKDPSVRVQEAAVRKNIATLQYCKGLSDSFKTEIAKCYPFEALRDMSNLSRGAKLAITRKYGKEVLDIRNISEDKQMKLVNKHPKLGLLMEHQSEQMQFCILNGCGNTYSTAQYVRNQTDAVKWFIIKRHIENISDVENPSEEMMLFVVDQDPMAIYYISQPTEAVKLRAVQKNGIAITKIKTAETSIQIAAAKNIIDDIKSIKSMNKSIYNALLLTLYKLIEESSHKIFVKELKKGLEIYLPRIEQNIDGWKDICYDVYYPADCYSEDIKTFFKKTLKENNSL